MRYVELNPVKAGMVSHPQEYRWSSYGGNAEGRSHPLLKPHPIYLRLGASELERQAAYQGLFESPIDEPALSEIREATNKGWVLGNERFRAEIESMLQRRTCPLPWGGDRHSKQLRQGRINRV
jgi:putative transposase